MLQRQSMSSPPVRLTASSAISAAVAALALTACGPHGGPETPPVAGTAETVAAPAAKTDSSPTAAPVVARDPSAQPVPAVSTREHRVVADRNAMGSVASIEPIRERPQGSGAGAVIGGVLGAVVGNQFGHHAGRAAMTGLGAVGGAVAGNNLERNHREGITGYRVAIRLDDGSTRSFERADVANLQIGDRVHLDATSFHRV